MIIADIFTDIVVNRFDLLIICFSAEVQPVKQILHRCIHRSFLGGIGVIVNSKRKIDVISALAGIQRCTGAVGAQMPADIVTFIGNTRVLNDNIQQVGT